MIYLERRDLQPIVDLAADLKAALLGVTHFTKGTEGRSPIDRVTGSLAFGALARVVMVAAKKQDEDEKPGVRIFMRAKSNIGPDEGGFEYELQQAALYSNPDIVASHVVFGEAIDGKACDVLAEAETIKDKDKDEDKAASLREATNFLTDLLLDGPLPTKEVRAAARDAGQAWRTVERAKSKLKISTGNRSARWPWMLPQGELRHEKKETHPNTLAELADIKKFKQKQKINLCQELRQTKNLAEIIGGDESEQNQEVKQTPPSPSSVLESDPNQTPEPSADGEKWESGL